VQAQNLAEDQAVRNRNRWRATQYPTKGEKAMERERRTDGFTALEDYFSGYEVYDPSRSKIGKAGDLFVGEDNEPEYVGVRTGFLGIKSTLVPWQIVEVRDAQKRLVVAADKNAVKGGPPFGDRWVTPEYENEIHSYYNLNGRRSSEDRGGYGAHFGHSKGDNPGEMRPVMRTRETETAESRGHGDDKGGGGLRESGRDLEDLLRAPRTEAELRVGIREREAGARG
jgi:hypothetical protein